jgi:hypothetical protein
VAVPPGGAEPPGIARTGSIDSAGYLQIGTSAANVIAIAFDGHPDALFIATIARGQHSVYAIGDPMDNARAVQGLVCDESSPGNGILANCVPTPLPTLSIDTVNVDLAGLITTPFEDERRQAAYDAIASRNDDLACVIRVYRQSDKDGIASRAAGTHAFPFAYYPNPATDLGTKPDDPSEIDGGIPPAPTAPPCSASDLAAIDQLYSCLASCSTPKDMTGVLEPPECILTNCVNQITGLWNTVKNKQQNNACFDCILFDAISENPLQHGKTSCLQDSRQPFVFGGQTDSMILSRYPLTGQQTYVLPSTGFRSAVLYAQVQLAQPVDFYCIDFVPTYLDYDFPYVGAYGADRTTTLPDGTMKLENGYVDELDLQAARTVAFIRAKGKLTGRPAIIAGVQAATQFTDSHGTVVVGAASPEVVAAFDQRLGGAFEAAEPPRFVPTCDVCPSPMNPYNGDPPGLYNLRTYLDGFLPNSTLENSVWGTDIAVPLHSLPYQPAPDGGKGPIGGTFPRVVRVIEPLAR